MIFILRSMRQLLILLMQLCELGQEVRYDQILLLNRPSRL